MNASNRERALLLLQINDSLFPIGGYSHSWGLETYVQRGLVHDEATAEDYLRCRLRYSVLPTDLLAVRLSYDAARECDADRLTALEEIMDASRLPSEVRDAAKRLGSRFIKTLEKMDVSYESDFFREYTSDEKRPSLCHPCAYGAACACAGIARDDAMLHFLYAQTSAAATNCVKLVPLSQSAGQRILSRLYPLMEELLEEASSMGEEMLCASAPAFDIRSIQHETLYSRLYMS